MTIERASQQLDLQSRISHTRIPNARVLAEVIGEAW